MPDENRTIGDEADDEDIKKIRDEFREEPKTVKLRINRVPEYVSNELKEEADQKFAGDYGMALTFWREKKQEVDQLHEVINDLTARVARLERAVEEIKSDEDEVDSEDLDTIN